MNIRQKAKHFKKLYEEKAKQIIRPVYIKDDYIIKEIRAGELLTLRDLAELHTEALEDELFRKLAPEIKKYMEVESYPVCENLGYSVKAQIRLAIKKL
jgi:ribosomal protein S13